jgi:pimeloyl-ACP methyl ester carboxylesterase
MVAGHPAYLVTLLVVGLGGLVAVGLATVTRARSDPHPTRAPSTARRWATWIARIVATVAVVALLGGLLWLRPLGATDVALEALSSGNGVEVVQSATRIELRPTGPLDPTGLVFYPGAKVDARAYAAILRPLAEAGHLVVIVKLPFGIAFTDLDAASSVIAAEQGVDRWVVAGHSLGGVAAARYAGGGHEGVTGLALWAAYPSDSIAEVPDLAVLSVSGTHDGLTTPAKIEASRADLPPDATFVAVPGAVHADFGDYGTQDGDGTPAISRAEAQRQITAATLDFLNGLDQPG